MYPEITLPQTGTLQVQGRVRSPTQVMPAKDCEEDPLSLGPCIPGQQPHLSPSSSTPSLQRRLQEAVLTVLRQQLADLEPRLRGLCTGRIQLSLGSVPHIHPGPTSTPSG